MDHMVAALSKTFKSPVVDTIQSLPQHQQVSYRSTLGILSKTIGKDNTYNIFVQIFSFVLQCDLSEV